MKILASLLISINTIILSRCGESDTEYKQKMERKVEERRKELMSEKQLFDPELVHEVQFDYPVVLKASFSKSGDKVAVMTALGGPEIFEVQSGEKLDLLPPDDGIFDLTFHPSERILGILYNSGDVLLWDYENQTELNYWKNNGEFSLHQNGSCLDFTPDGRYFAFITEGDEAVKVVDLQSGGEIASIDVGFVNSLSIHPNGSHLAISMERGFKIFSLKDGEELFFMDVESAHSFVMWHPDGNMISVTGFTGGPTRSWRFPSGERLNDLENFGTAANYNPIAITSSADLIWCIDAYNSKNKIFAYSSESRELQILIEHKKPSISCLFSPNGARKIYAISDSGYLMVWTF